MTTSTKNPYEAMFLISQQVASDFAGAIQHIRDLLDRAGAEVLAMQKWDERRLAYEIDKQRRGIYILTYFYAEPDAIAPLERNCNISEQIMRVLITRADHLSEDQMRAADRTKDLEAEARMRAERAAERTETGGARVESRAEQEAAQQAQQQPDTPAPESSETTPAGDNTENQPEAQPEA